MMDLNGKSVIKTTLENIVNTNLFDAVYVVTDSQIIYDHLKQFQGELLILNFRVKCLWIMIAPKLFQIR